LSPAALVVREEKKKPGVAAGLSIPIEGPAQLPRLTGPVYEGKSSSHTVGALCEVPSH
jgi:hypothetical protein